MPIDREEALRRAEKLLRQGRLDAAIDEYTQLATAFPADLSIVNALGDLLVRGGFVERASVEFQRIADHFFREGFLPKAAALYKKVLKIAPEHAHALTQLVEIAVAQGMTLDARTSLLALVEIHQSRGDAEALGVALRRLADLDPNDVALQQRAADVQAKAGDAQGAVDRLKQLAARLSDAGRADDSLRVWQAVHALEPSHADTRLLLARAALAQQRLDEAAEFLGEFTLEGSAEWVALHTEVALRRGELGGAESGLEVMSASGASDADLVEFALLHGCDVATAFVGAAKVAGRLAQQGRHAEAVAALQQFLGHHPRYVPALSELLERAIDADLASVAVACQRGLVEAHLESGDIEAARFVAEDLVARAPDDVEHQACLRRVFEAAGEGDPDTRLHQHLSTLTSDVSWDDPSGTVEAPSVVATTDVVSSAPGAAGAREEVAAPGAAPDEETTSVGATAVSQPQSQTGLRTDAEIDLTPALEALASSALVASGPGPAASARAGAPVASGADAVAGVEGEGEASVDRQRLSAALSLLAAGLHDEAEALLHDASQQPATRGAALLALGDLERTRHHLDAAEVFYQRVLAEQQAAELQRRARYGLGCTLAEAARTPEALVVFLELLADADEYLDTRARVDQLSADSAGGTSFAP